MRRTVPLALLGTMAALALQGCDSIIDYRGFAPTPGSVEKLEAGTQSREDVIRLIGTPTAVATFNPNVWYYISQTQDTYAFFAPAITEQKVMQLNFDDAGRLKTIKNYDLKNNGVGYAISNKDINQYAGTLEDLKAQIIAGKITVPSK